MKTAGRDRHCGRRTTGEPISEEAQRIAAAVVAEPPGVRRASTGAG